MVVKKKGGFYPFLCINGECIVCIFCKLCWCKRGWSRSVWFYLWWRIVLCLEVRFGTIAMCIRMRRVVVRVVERVVVRVVVRVERVVVRVERVVERVERVVVVERV